MKGTHIQSRDTRISPRPCTPMDEDVSGSPGWAPPRSPLPPYKLAKLANALGVSTPIPAISSPPSPFTVNFRRSPTPSTISNNTLTSKYLLHVLPPLSLPHDTQNLNLSSP